jgi:hypothetical protein
MKTINGCINQVKDENGKVYHIPNFCINDPYFEKIIYEQEDDGHIPKLIHISVYDLYENRKSSLEIMDNVTGKEFKQLYCESIGQDYKMYRIRILFSGIEILDDHKIYKHNVKNEYVIQLMKVSLMNPM